jgi:enoyl-CoA hydratase/carnithine racemase
MKPMKSLLLSSAIALTAGTAFADQPDYANVARGLSMDRDDRGVLVVTINDGNGGPITFTAQDHTEFTEAFYRIAQDRENKVVILTGAGDWMAQIDFSTFGNVGDANVWSQVHDEGVQILENIANIRVPVIAAIEGRAHIHSEYALMANVIVAGKGATFSDLPHFAGGIVPGDGIFTTWSYRAGPGRAEAWLLNPQPISAEVAYNWGVVSEVVPDGSAVDRAQEIADLYLKQPEVTRRNTRIHFIQPLKERIVAEVGYGLALEGASASALVASFNQ